MYSNLFIFYNNILDDLWLYFDIYLGYNKTDDRVSYNISKVIKLITDTKIIATKHYTFKDNARTTQNVALSLIEYILSIGKVDTFGSIFFINFSTI